MNITTPRYSAVLLGALNSLPDYPFNITYYSNSKRDAVVSYHNCVAPYSLALLDAFTNRPDGDVQLYRDGTLLETFNVDTVSYYLGPRSSSIAVAGSKQTTNAVPITLPVQPSEVTERRRDSFGRIVLSLTPSNTVIRPADFVTYAGDTYLVMQTAMSAGSRVNTRVLTLELQP